MIMYDSDEAIIKPEAIEYKKGYENIKLPKVAIGVFSKVLTKKIVKRFKCIEVGYITNAVFDRSVYILKYKDKEFTFFQAGISSPLIVGDVHFLKRSGVETIILFGNCGVLDSTIEDCSIIIPTRAYRDEGTSYHYLPKSNFIKLDSEYKKEFKKVLKDNEFSFREGYTWTTDAIYRETKEKVNYYKQKGAVCVEMEGTAIAAVCKKLKADYFTFYYAGDNLDAAVWDERSLSGLTKIDKKKEVMTLALELSRKI